MRTFLVGIVCGVLLAMTVAAVLELTAEDGQ